MIDNPIKKKLEEDLKQALREKNRIKISTIRMLLAAVKNAIIDNPNFSEPDFFKLVEKEIRKRKEAIAFYTQAGRSNLASKEKEEIEIISTYLPAKISKEKVEKMVREYIENNGLSGIENLGKVMKHFRSRLAGQIEGKELAEIVKKLLQ